MAGTRYCESCGAVLQDDYRFCEACGAPVRVLSSGPSGAPAGYGAEITSPGYGNVPDFGGGAYGYGGFDSAVPGRVIGGNDPFVGAVPPPGNGGSVSFYPEDPNTEIFGGERNDRSTEEYRNDWYGAGPGMPAGGGSSGEYSVPGYDRDRFGRDFGPGYDRYPGDAPAGAETVSGAFERGLSDGIIADHRLYDEPYEKPKLKNSVGSASANAKGGSVSDEAKPYFREGGDL